MYGKELTIKRTLVGLSRADLAKRVGVSRQQIYNVERSKEPISEPLSRVINEEIGKAFVKMEVNENIKIYAIG